MITQRTPYIIVSCDGGGIRGVTAARLLDAASQLTDRVQNANFYAGTSTGSITACALAYGLTPPDITELYREHGATIFGQRDLIDLLSPVDELGRAKYTHHGLDGVLRGVFGDIELYRLRAYVAVTSFDLDRWRPKVWTNFGGGDDSRITELVLRSCSAPTYFPAGRDAETGRQHVDGGVVANNPTMCAVAAAINHGVRLERLRVLSIGTGQVDASWIEGLDRDLIHDAGVLGWAPHLIPLMLEGGERIVDYQCRQLLGPRYCRLNVPLSKRYAIDDHESIGEMIAETDAHIETSEFKAAIRRWLEEDR